MPASVAQVLQRELGSPNATIPTGYQGSWEETAELRFPYNQIVYDRMRKTWSQGRALVRGATAPILGTRWTLRGSRVRPEVLRLCTAELGLFEDDEGRRRPREGGVVWDDFLRHAMLHGPLGFMPFELVTQAGPPDAALGDVGLGVVQHLLKIDPRFPRTLVDIIIEPDGSFGGVRQQVFRNDPRFPNSSPSWQVVPIPASSMVMFVNEREGADWYGQSWLRDAYKHWLINDMLYRVGALSVDRTGMGLPVVTYPKDAPGGRHKALQIASELRAGEDSGVALEEGWTVELVGVTGSVADSKPLIEMHDQAAGRGMMQMFLNLGHDRGSQSLGETFLDYFLMTERALVRYIEEVVTEQVLRRLVAWNYGPDEPYPALVGQDPAVNPIAVSAALSTLAGAGLVYSDKDLRGELRRRMDLPAEGPDAVPVGRRAGDRGADPGSIAGAPGPGSSVAPTSLPTVADRRGVEVAVGAPVGARVADGNIRAGVVSQVVAGERAPIVVTLSDGSRHACAPGDVQVVGAPLHLLRPTAGPPADPRLLSGGQLAAHARALADRLELASA